MSDDGSPLGRRGFLGLCGAGAALAGVTTISGCLRKPREPIVPLGSRPEDLIPGQPRYYATATLVGGAVLGLLVESQDGRPTKIEGLAHHPANKGAASAWAQAEVLDLYDPDRSRHPLHGGKAASWDAFAEFAGAHFARLRAVRGRGLAVLLDYRPSPTLRRVLDALQAVCPAARLYLHDAAYPRQTHAGAALVGLGHDVLPLLAPDRADVIFALDSDFLGHEGDAVRQQRLFAQRREVISPHASLNRLYVVEPFPTLTGAMADHRLRLRGGEAAAFLEGIALELCDGGLLLPEGAAAIRGRLGGAARERHGRWIKALATDLLRNKGRALVVVGERQPPRVHALGWLLNVALGAVGGLAPRPPVAPPKKKEEPIAADRTLTIVREPDVPPAGTIGELAAAIQGGGVRTLILLGGNPAYDAPADLDFARLVTRVPERVHLGSHVDETATVATWHLPRCHFLEAWGDWRAADGTLSIQQPLIAPLHGGLSAIELVAQLAGLPATRGYELVRETWRARAGGSARFDRRWRRWLHDGIVGGPAAPLPPPPAPPAPTNSDSPAAAPTASPSSPRPVWDRLLAFGPATAPAAGPDSLEASFHVSAAVFDGRYANNGWLQELPDSLSKLTWDNAAFLAPATARALDVRMNDLVELTLGGRVVQAPVFVLPGTAEDTVALTLGYGRRVVGQVGRGAGFDAGALRSSAAPTFAGGARLRKLGRRVVLAQTQEHGSMEGRPIVREATIAEYAKQPGFAARVAGPPLRSLWTEPLERQGRQWGMVIDLNACLGCNACVVACQAENNVPIVGKQRVIENREMHWVRVDRYFIGDEADPRVRFIPVPCMHCENAPCEQVCPVAATAHSPEGLNDQAYNRCIGTRYCSNNCPFKVRRFNFFQYNKGADPLLQMQKNPDVTLRFRGTMEKCTYCVQRIQEAKIKAKVEGRAEIPDGTIVPACAQTCPAKAIVFGDIKDETSLVSQRRQQARNYALLAELNIKPRTTYLAKLRNPNPDLERE